VSFEPGALIGKRYRLERLIGSGGMGEVFAATDTVLARPVAVKIVDAVDARRAEETRQVFLQEARIAAAIGHPAIVKILDFGMHAELLPFIVMELLEGETLAGLLTRRRSLPRAWVLDVAARVLQGLSAAHASGVIHRDIKPENIFLAQTDTGLSPKILDFGISKTVDHSGRATVTTQHGHVVGTPAYMSPEQARGLKHIDQRTDVYSMGVVLYELLSGDVPFSSENPGDLLMLIMTAPPEPISRRAADLPAALTEVVMRALAKDPEERFDDAAEMLAHLVTAAPVLGAAHGPMDVLTGSHPTVRVSRAEPRHSPIPSEKTRAGRSTLIASISAGAFVLGVLLTAGLIVFANRWSQPKAAEPTYIVVQPAKVGAEAAPSVEPLAPTAPRPAEPREGRASSPALASVAAAFKAQKAGIEDCVNAFPEMVAVVPKLSLRLSLDGRGVVQSVALEPSDLAKSELGQCILRTAQAMHFEGTGSPLAFEVPLTARRGSGP
jgi:eukaryotic-like serine/threonine-protein kinase